MPRIQITSWANTGPAAWAVADRLRILLMGFNGSMGATAALDVQAGLLLNEFEDIETNSKRIRIITDWRFHHAEAVA